MSFKTLKLYKDEISASQFHHFERVKWSLLEKEKKRESDGNSKNAEKEEGSRAYNRKV